MDCLRVAKSYNAAPMLTWKRIRIICYDDRAYYDDSWVKIRTVVLYCRKTCFRRRVDLHATSVCKVLEICLEGVEGGGGGGCMNNQLSDYIKKRHANENSSKNCLTIASGRFRYEPRRETSV